MADVRFPVFLLTVLVCLVGVAPALAQAGDVVVDDPDGIFSDQAAIRAAAQRLAGEGPQVVVIGLRDAGTNTEAADASVDRRLQELGIAQSRTQLRGDQLVLAVAQQPPNYAGIWYVRRYSDELDPVIARIYRERMLPRLSSGDYGGAIVAALEGVRTTLNPPTPPLVWILVGVLGIAVLAAIAIPALRARKAAGETLAAARERLAEARQAAGVALADLGRRVEAAREKAQYDKISYSAEDAAAVAGLQRRGETLFGEAQQAFDVAEEARHALARPAAADLDALAARYEEVARLAHAASEPIVKAEQMRVELDATRTPATGETRKL